MVDLPKLVRDKIPKLIEDSGRIARTHTARPSEFEDRLRNKMIEEIGELYEGPCIEEAADVYEVFLTMLGYFKINLPEVVSAAHKKRIAKGAFHRGVILDEIEGEKNG